MHPRRKIRDFIGAALNANPHIAPVVAVGRVITIGVEKLPSVQVYTGREEVTGLIVESPRVERRVLEVRVEIVTDATTSQRAQDLLDDLAEQVEISVLEDETHGDIAEKTEYRETLPAADASGDRNVVGFIIRFEVTYQFDYGDRDLPDAERIVAGIDIESETVDQVEAEVDLALDQ